MKTKLITLNVLTLLALAAVLLFGQGGSLAPSQSNGALDGANNAQPSMKTLDGVEPRIPVGQATTPSGGNALFRITAPGSYYLTGNIIINPPFGGGVCGIEILADDVTLDLMGFALIGVPDPFFGTAHGVHVPAQQLNLTIRNGTVHGWGKDGIRLTDPINCRLIDLNLSGNVQSGLRMIDGKGAVISRCAAAGNSSGGMFVGRAASIVNCAVYSNTGEGIETGDACAILDCSVSSNGGIGSTGIRTGDGSTVSRCTAKLNGGSGISAGQDSTVTNCAAGGNNSTGILASSGSTVSRCAVRSNADGGISGDPGSTISGCAASSNSNYGIQAFSDCLVLHNICNDNNENGSNGIGIEVRFLSTSGCRIEGNHVTNNDCGIKVNGDPNLIIWNSASANTTANYDIAAGNDFGPLSGAATATSPWANF